VTTSLLTISSFARTVGLTPSALRFYDDAGLLPPAVVDDRTGYRYYAPGQQRTAVLVRQMRELDVPLITMRAVLAATPERAEELLRAHADRLTERADRAWNAVDVIVRELRGAEDPVPGRPTRVCVGGPELAAAIRQVAPFVAGSDDGAGLDRVLLDIADGELTVAATDRYRLAARSLRVDDQDGPPRRLPVAVDQLTGLADWLRRCRRVELSAVGQTLIISDRDHGAGEVPGPDCRELGVADDSFPDYRSLVDDLAERPDGMRLIMDRIELLELVSADQDSTVLLDPDPRSDSVMVGRRGDHGSRRVAAVCSGDLHRVGFNPGYWRRRCRAASAPTSSSRALQATRPWSGRPTRAVSPPW
jgi:DNA-binding transcriptional MerR regulator